MRLLIIFCLALSLHLLHASDTVQKKQSFVEKMRPTLVSLIGTEWTEKLIGEEEKILVEDAGIVLPALPKMIEDSKSTDVYSKKADKVQLAKEIEEKYYYTYIREIYEATRQAKPNDDEISKLMNVLSQGGSREGVYRSLVLDSIYGGMENYDKSIKSNAADFAIYFYEKYLGKKIAKESLKGMNVYTMKRLISEKSLEMIDAFGDNRDQLESWYAVASSDMASKFPMAFNGKTRKDTSSKLHKTWASKVPVQHIKSEMLVKLHQAFNSMM